MDKKAQQEQAVPYAISDCIRNEKGRELFCLLNRLSSYDKLAKVAFFSRAHLLVCVIIEETSGCQKCRGVGVELVVSCLE